MKKHLDEQEVQALLDMFVALDDTHVHLDAASPIMRLKDDMMRDLDVWMRAAFRSPASSPWELITVRKLHGEGYNRHIVKRDGWHDNDV